MQNINETYKSHFNSSIHYLILSNKGIKEDPEWIELLDPYENVWQRWYEDEPDYRIPILVLRDLLL